jgi:hypothetical protein
MALPAVAVLLSAIVIGALLVVTCADADPASRLAIRRRRLHRRDATPRSSREIPDSDGKSFSTFVTGEKV